MPSINVNLNFFSHRKTIRLSAQLGDQAITCLLRLWCYAGQHDPEYGSLGDMLDYEIEHIANWSGEQGRFVRSLISIGFLDMVDGKARIHGWHDHAKHLIVYRERAKKAASVKWNAQLSHAASHAASNTASNDASNDASSYASSMLQADTRAVKSIGYASSNASSNAKDALSIVPIQYNTIHSNTVKNKNIDHRDDRFSHDFLLFWDAYPRKVGKQVAWKEWQKLKHRPAIEEILGAIQQAKETEQWKKENGQFIPHPKTWLHQGRWDDECVVSDRVDTSPRSIFRNIKTLIID